VGERQDQQPEARGEGGDPDGPTLAERLGDAGCEKCSGQGADGASGGEQPKHNRSWEIPYLATGKSWRISTPAASRTNIDVFVDEIAAAAPDQIDTSWLGLRLSPSDLTEFRQRLRELLDDFATRPYVPSEPAWSLFVSLHPDPNRP